MKTLTIIEYSSYLIVLLGAIWTSYKRGEHSGSIYMLDYLRSNSYTKPNGTESPYLSDIGYNRFVAHMRKEKEMKDNV